MVDEPALQDQELDPSLEPQSSAAWLNLISDAEKAFKDYQDKSDHIDKAYADLEKLASVDRSREFQMFWANVQVLGPSVYSRPPVPVVVPRFRDQDPVARTASEVLERATSVVFESADIDGVMRLIRDDLVILGRGVSRVWLDKKDLRIGHVDRRDFLHDPARNWHEVDWVAFRAWMTPEQMEDRFASTSGDAWRQVAYQVQKDDVDRGAADRRQKCGVWEIWCKSRDTVVWVAEGSEELLDSDAPHLKLEGFFPCPRPAYSTVRRRTLVPVPDMAMYKDQLEEINELTARISALTEAVKVRGFYPAGASEIGDAVEAAIKTHDDRTVLVPISNWAAFGQGGGGEPIIWLPIEMVAKVIASLVEMRKQVIDDVYQITGLSDIMRGSTVASETLGAQELKSQYGSIRIRDRQDELVRVARDITRISAEILAENSDGKALLDMSRMQLPTAADIAKQVKAIETQVQEALKDPRVQQMIEQEPEKAQAVQQQAQQQVMQLQQTVTIDVVMKLLKDQRIRPFVLDIETDSTIAPDENAQKQRATEYVTAVSGLLGQAQIVQQVPQLAPVFSEVIKFLNQQFRAGREVQATVDEFADAMKEFASQPKPPDPAQAKAQADAQQAQMQGQLEQAKAQADMQRQQVEQQIKMQEAQSKAADDDLARRQREQEAVDAAMARQQDLQTKAALADVQMRAAEGKAAIEQQKLAADIAAAAEKHQQELEVGMLNIELLRTKIQQASAATENAAAATEASIAAKRASPGNAPAAS